jgi:hypothetical protein
MAEKEKSNEQYYSKLIVYPKRKTILGLFVAAFAVFFASIIAGNMTSHQSWWYACVPLTILGLILCLFPSTEEWHYSPWQTQAAKQERTFHNNTRE